MHQASDGSRSIAPRGLFYLWCAASLCSFLFPDTPPASNDRRGKVLPTSIGIWCVASSSLPPKAPESLLPIFPLLITLSKHTCKSAIAGGARHCLHCILWALVWPIGFGVAHCVYFLLQTHLQFLHGGRDARILWALMWPPVRFFNTPVILPRREGQGACLLWVLVCGRQLATRRRAWGRRGEAAD